MIRDVLTVMWKEWRDMPVSRGGFKGGKLNQIAFVLILGVLMPLQMGKGFVDSPIAAILALWGPFLMTATLTADSFAGERERRTLETLLASRLSDKAILIGKIATVVCYSWTMTMLILLVGLVTANIRYGHGRLLLYPASVMFGTPVLALVIAVFLSSIGVLVSLRAATVRQAAQILSIGFLVVFLLPMLLTVLPPSAVQWLGRLLDRVGPRGLVSAAFGMLLLLDIVLLKVSIARFCRSRLILE